MPFNDLSTGHRQTARTQEVATTRPKRKRRTPEEAREEILLAAEALILEDGPAELKFQSLADRSNVAVSNVYHHFGGVLEIKRGLAEKVFDELTRDLMTALGEEADNEPRIFARKVMSRVYSVLRSERYAKLIGWIVLSTELGELEGFTRPLPAMAALIAGHMGQHLPPDTSERLAQFIIYNVAIVAVGEGLVGPAIKTALTMDEAAADGSLWLGDHWEELLARELEKAAS